jgi:hypothetical protein
MCFANTFENYCYANEGGFNERRQELGMVKEIRGCDA